MQTCTKALQTPSMQRSLPRDPKNTTQKTPLTEETTLPGQTQTSTDLRLDSPTFSLTPGKPTENRNVLLSASYLLHSSLSSLPGHPISF